MSRVDVALLREALDRNLGERQARDTGICSVREELYQQSFEEIIRQVCLTEPERGLLLLRVRDELEMTKLAYLTLYKSATTYAMKKQLQAEHGMHELTKQCDTLEQKKQKFENRVREQQKKIEEMTQKQREKKAEWDKKCEDEVEFLKYKEQHLTKFLN